MSKQVWDARGGGQAPGSYEMHIHREAKAHQTPAALQSLSGEPETLYKETREVRSQMKQERRPDLLQAAGSILAPEAEGTVSADLIVETC